MTFQDRIRRRLQKTNNFKYLDDLINSGQKEVKLTSDIVLDSSEEELYGEGISIETDGLIIDGDGYLIDGKEKARIFRIENKNVTFKNITFKNGSSHPNNSSITSIFNSLQGGAVSASGSELSFIDCSFRDNVDNRGGAIFLGFSEANIDNCEFIGNIGRRYAGAIFNDELSSLTVMNSEFRNNAGVEEASDIRSVESSLKVINCEFSNPHRDETSIEAHSYGNLVLKDSLFNQSGISVNCLTVIKDCNFDDSTVDVTNFGNLYCLEDQEENIPFNGDNIHYLNDEMDWVRELTEHELAREFLKYFPKFTNAEFDVQDKLHDEMGEFLEIWREIWPHESNFVIADLIVNVLTLDSEDIQENYLDNISREGATDKDAYDRLYMILEDVLEFVDLPPKNFKQLDELIHSDEVNLRLTFDVLLDGDEAEEFKEGIKIDVDNLVLDGQNHVIDADNSVSIFKIDAKNVTIKNTVFKNAFSDMGGAVSNIGDVKFEDCKFCKNTASELGGAIVNDEKMTISNCEFENNSSGGVGGAIAATFASELQISGTKFIKNTVSFDISCRGKIIPSEAQGFGGAIYNNGKLDITESEFSENSCERNGGAMIVLPDSKISIEKSLFRDNHAKIDGGVIHTMGDINIDNSEFRNNSADNNAGVFDATKSSKLKISNSEFENNSAKNGNVIVTKGKLELIETEISDDDIVYESIEGDDTQQALPDENEASDGEMTDDENEASDGEVSDDEHETSDGEVSDDENEAAGDENGEEESNQEFPEGYDDYAREFKEYFEKMLEDKDIEGKGILLSLTFAIWANKFPEDANLIAAALLMAKVYDDELIKTILDDYSEEEYRKRLTEYDPIDEELSSWFMAIALLGMIFGNSKDDEVTSKGYGEKYINLCDDFQDASDDRQNELYDEMKGVVKDWKENYPDDLNMSLAYITLNAPYISDEKLKEALDNLEGQSASDEDSYERLYNDCKEVLELKNINLDDYLEE